MGVDTIIVLPAQVRVDNVAEVIGACIGLEREWMDLDNGARSARVLGIKVSSCANVPTMAMIEWCGGNEVWPTGSIGYHFEGGGERGGRLLRPRSYPDAITLGHRLVDFFGGIIKYQDYDGKIDYQQDWKIELCQASDGREWDDLQERIMAIRPITKEEVEQYSAEAAY